MRSMQKGCDWDLGVKSSHQDAVRPGLRAMVDVITFELVTFQSHSKSCCLTGVLLNAQVDNRTGLARP